MVLFERLAMSLLFFRAFLLPESMEMWKQQSARRVCFHNMCSSGLVDSVFIVFFLQLTLVTAFIVGVEET